jgi:DNA-binding NtrC family response regulator
MAKILIVDDDEDLRAIVKEVLRDEGFSLMEASDGLKAIEVFKADRPQAVLLDLQMPRMNGLEILQELKKIDSHVPVIILTAHGDIPTAVKAIKNGAYDFSVKPPEFEKLIITLKRAIERLTLQAEIAKVSLALESSLEHLLGKSPAIRKVIKEIRQVAETDFSVIIQGETGTGKSVVASAIQNMSKRAGQPFVSVDIGLIPDNLIESELFGYKKGSFTGAQKDKIGYFETAHFGTIFLDELENMSPLIQCKLLTVIEKKRVYPLGDTNPVDIDVRILSATNSDIKLSVQKKEFREDLFYRLGEFIISLPPLRERGEDIQLFAQKFIFEACAELNKQIKEMTSSAIARLTKHAWPGNIRELKNVMRRAVLLTDKDIIDEGCIDFLMNEQPEARAASSLHLKEAVKELERRMILEALEKSRGNKTKTAEVLNISYRTLFEKIREYGIDTSQDICIDRS